MSRFRPRISNLGHWLVPFGLLGLLAGTGIVAGQPISGALSGFPTSAFLAHWWVFPASILFSAIALSAGVSGALFFSPFFILAVGLQPAQAIGAGLLTEVFGMGNGLLNYVRQGVVDYATAKWLLLGALPAVVLGSFGAHYVPTTVLKGIFGGGLILLGAYLVYQDPPEELEAGEKLDSNQDTDGSKPGMTTLETRDETVYSYETCWRIPGVSLAALGGFITGLISAGLPELTTTQLIVRCRLPPRVAIATSVFVLGIAAIAGATVHALAATPVWYVIAWSIPGVLIGGTIGTRFGKYVPSELMEPVLGVVFSLVGSIVIWTEFFV